MIKKIFLGLFLIILIFIGGCKSKDYENIIPKQESIEDIDTFFEYIEIFMEKGFDYSFFLDVRTKTDYNTERIRYFKTNIFYQNNLTAAESKILNMAAQYGKKAYIFVIGSGNNQNSLDAVLFLREKGYLNVKHLSMGIEDFIGQLILKNYRIESYIDYGDCGC